MFLFRKFWYRARKDTLSSSLTGRRTRVCSISIAHKKPIMVPWFISCCWEAEGTSPGLADLVSSRPLRDPDLQSSSPSPSVPHNAHVCVLKKQVLVEDNLIFAAYYVSNASVIFFGLSDSIVYLLSCRVMYRETDRDRQTDSLVVQEIKPYEEMDFDLLTVTYHSST